MKRKRIVYRLGWNAGRRRWQLSIEGSSRAIEVFSFWMVKKQAEKRSRKLLASLYQRDGRLRQLRICGKNGRVIEEATYGADPRRYKS